MALSPFRNIVEPFAPANWSKHRDRAAGVKLRMGAMTGNHGIEALEKALAAAREAAALDQGTVRDLTGAVADQLPTGPGLAGWIADADPRVVPEFDLPGLASACQRIAAWAPLPMATSVMTADTPMIMPSIVNPVRILLRPRALNAIRNVLSGDMRSLLVVAGVGLQESNRSNF